MGALVVPAIAAPAPVSAWSGTVTCSASDLNFRVYAGVPTYLLGFIPLDDGQTVTLTHAGGFLESAGWTVTDDAGWLNEDPLFGVVGCIDRTQDVTVRVNTDGLSAGTYTATITFKFTTCATDKITVPVTVNVIEPAVMGPLGIGLGNIFNSDEEEYGGIAVQLLTNPDNMMDMQAIETDGCWNLNIQRATDENGEVIVNDDGSITITGGTLNIEGEDQPITWGTIVNLGVLVSMMGGALPVPPDTDWGENYVFLFSLGEPDYQSYIGIDIEDISSLMDLLPLLLGSGTSGEETDPNAPPDETNSGDTNNAPAGNSEDLVIPLKPVLDLMPSLMPVLTNLLQNETVLSIINAIAPILPPIMIVMPMDVMMQLFSGLMPS
jgi:hypothetical protein